MTWVTMAVISTALMGVASVVDSHLLSRRLPSMRAFMLPVSFIHLTYATIFIILYPLPAGIGFVPLLAIFGSGAFRTAAVFMMLYTLKKEEVSRVIPIIYTSPIFVAVMAVPLLGEHLTALHWLAIVVVVGGAMLISAERNPADGGRLISRTILMLFASSLCWAVSDIMRKYALDFMSYWNGFSISTFVMAGGFLVFSLRPLIIRQWRELAEKKQALGYVFLDETVSIVGILLQFYAMQNGPVALVSTIIGSRPVFVAVYSILLSLILPNFLIRFPSRKIMAMRFLAIAMICAGIAIIYLN